MQLKKQVDSLIKKLNLKKRSTIYVSGSIFSFGLKSTNAIEFCHYIYKGIISKIGVNGNIVVPTATYNICNTNRYFHKNLKSYLMGIFSEYIRNKKKSYRSNHPIWSFSGIGNNIKKILKNVPVSAFGTGSVFERLLNYDSYFLCLGEPNNVLAMIHYVETITGVPYRYNKEFYIKVKENGKIKKKYFTLLVLFKPNILERDFNRKIIKILKRRKVFKIFKFIKGNIYFCNYNLLIKELKKILAEKPKIWLKNENIKQKKYHVDNYGK